MRQLPITEVQSLVDVQLLREIEEAQDQYGSPRANGTYDTCRAGGLENEDNHEGIMIPPLPADLKEAGEEIFTPQYIP